MTASPAATKADLDQLFVRMEKMVHRAIDTRIVPLLAEVANEILTAVADRFDEVDERLDNIEKRLYRLENRWDEPPPRWLQTI